MIRRIAIILWFGFSIGGLVGTPVTAGEAGDAVFAERGPWTLPENGLNWDVHVEGPEVPGFLPIKAGSLTLEEVTDPSDNQPVLQVTQKTDTRTRKIGPFPISGGDPVLTFFLEQTTRDIATFTGGSPYYIRNRLKDALFRGGDIAQQDEGDGRIATFRPFEGDPNASRMQGFESLILSFVLDDSAKAPIREFEARTEGDMPGYVNHMVLK